MGSKKPKPLSKLDRQRLARTKGRQLRQYFPGYANTWLMEQRRQARKEFPEALARDEVLLKYARLVKQIGRVPKNEELHLAITRNTYRHYFESFDSLDRAARQAHPDKFPDVLVEEVRTTEIRKSKRYVITTAVTGAPVNMPFLRSLQTYCKSNEAELLVMTCEDPAMSRDARRGHAAVSSHLSGATIVGGDVRLNDNLILRTIKVSAKMLDPTTGIPRIGHRGGSTVLASPKQRMQVVPNIGEYPHVIMTPGAVTQPDYLTERYWSLRLAYMAEMDHVCGALVVEIMSPKRFQFRQLQADKDGSVVDLGVRYTPTKVAGFEPPEALIFGDLHVEYEEAQHRKVRYQMLRDLKPKRIYAHDVLDCGPISHHDVGRFLTRAKREHTDLRKHMEAAREELVALAQYADVYVVRSNHDEALDKYLDSLRYRFDPQNFDLAHDLAKHMLQGKNPFAEYCGGISGVVFLDRDEASKVEGIELGQHGDKGPNGSRGSPRSLEVSYGPSVVGHSHQPGIYRSLWVVGTSSKLRMDYNKGPSGWMNSHALVYKGGLRQLVNVIDGKYHG